MKTFLLTLFSLITMISFTGCGEEKAASMTEGVEMSEIEAYEEANRKMESEDESDMDEAE